METSKREPVRESLARWVRVGPELAAIRRRELRAYRFEESRDLVNDLLEMAAEHAKPRRTSGLAELQNVLRKAYA